MFRDHGDTLLIDSGSKLNAKQRRHFDIVLPNVYYSGLLNRAHAVLLDSKADWMLFICSDVMISDAGGFISRFRETARNPSIGLIAPAIDRPCHHRQMQARSFNRRRNVPFVDGYCVAVRKDVLGRVCPIDTSINRIGWGIETHLGYAAKRLGLSAVVDDAIRVAHPDGSGYGHTLARTQRTEYFRHIGLGLRFYWYLTDRWWMKNSIWDYVLKAIPWRIFGSRRIGK